MSRIFAKADAKRLPLPDKSVDLVLGSPPYIDARHYLEGGQNINISRKTAEWIDWMLAVTAEAVRVSRGLVLWVVAGVTRKHVYQPGPEGLLYEWWKRGGHCWRPAYWHRVGIPGSGGKQWLRADVEYVLAFTSCTAAIPWADNTANGHPPKWAPGGEMSYRLADGQRTNEDDPWLKRGRGNNLGGRKKNGEKNLGTNHQGKDAMGFHQYGGRGRNADGTKKITRRISQGHGPDGDTRQDDVYVPPVLANPGTLIKGIKVGGGLMGHDLAHENEAPYPVKLASWFIRGWAPPGGIVCDPFSGSASTGQAALELGRDYVGFDLRDSQCQLGLRRTSQVQLQIA